MLRLVIAVAVLLLLVTPTRAQPGPVWFQVNMSCTYTPVQARCVIVNSSSLPMYCDLRADAKLITGHFLYAYMKDWVQPQDWRHVFVYSNPPNPPIQAVVGGGMCRH